MPVYRDKDALLTHAARLDALRSEDGLVQIPRLVEVEGRDGYRLWARFEDGTEGEVDMVKEPDSAPARWFEAGYFASAHVRTEDRAVAWADDSWDACPKSIWLEIKGFAWSDLNPFDPTA